MQVKLSDAERGKIAAEAAEAARALAEERAEEERMEAESQERLRRKRELQKTMMQVGGEAGEECWGTTRKVWCKESGAAAKEAGAAEDYDAGGRGRWGRRGRRWDGQGPAAVGKGAAEPARHVT